jgi:hypothetical protein
MRTDETNVIELLQLRRKIFAVTAYFVFVACLGFFSFRAQAHGVGLSVPESYSNTKSLFFGVSNDPELGKLAWLICIDRTHRDGQIFVAPRMLKFSNYALGRSGSLIFQSKDFIGRSYRFNGFIKSGVLVGKIQLIDMKSGGIKESWKLTANPVLPPDSRPSIEQSELNARYSNVAYSSEGGDQTGVDIQLFSTTAGKTGMIVFYESYWGEPTFTPLVLTQVSIKKNVIHFSVEMHEGVAHYHLILTSAGGIFNRDDVPNVKGDEGLVLKKIRKGIPD